VRLVDDENIWQNNKLILLGIQSHNVRDLVPPEPQEPGVVPDDALLPHDVRLEIFGHPNSIRSGRSSPLHKVSPRVPSWPVVEPEGENLSHVQLLDQLSLGGWEMRT
jgi:hypothetical protein